MKTQEILDQIQQAGVITEQQINLLKKRANAGENLDMEYIWNHGVRLTKEQEKKGLQFLLSQWKTPAGKDRKTNPFGYGEQETLETFELIDFNGFYDLSRHDQKAYYTPLYTVYGDNFSFQYYYNGTVSIVG